MDAIKVMATGGNMTVTSDPLKAQFTREEVAAIVGVANAAGLRVTAHARGVDGIRVAAEANAHGIEHCRMEVGAGEWKFDHELARQLADKGIFAAPTLAASYRAFQRQAAGGKVGIRPGAIPFPTARRTRRCCARRASASWSAPTPAPRCAVSTRRCTWRWRRWWARAGRRWRPSTRARSARPPPSASRRRWAASSPASWPISSSRAATPPGSISDVRQVEAVFLGGRQVASGGKATLDARPTPWPEDAIAPRTEYRSTDVGPRLPRA